METFSWYAAKVHSSAQKMLEDYFSQENIECFIPREYVMTEDKDGHRHKVLRPVVRNLIFIKKSLPELDMRLCIETAPSYLYIIRKEPDSKEYYEIPDSQMMEFKAMCNPDIAMRKYISEDDAKLKIGMPVKVTAGPLRGLTGRLVRSNKKYFLLKEVPGMGVMLKVTRWCCKPLTEKSC